MLDPTLSATMPDALGARLSPGERILWHGRPRQGLVLRGRDAFQIPFSLVWCAFVASWMHAVIAHRAPPLFVIWGIPFVCVGLYLLAGRFLVEARLRACTTYAVTEERILILSGWYGSKLTSLPLATLSDMTLELKSTGTGTIVFGHDTAPPWVYTDFPDLRTQAAPRFDLFPDARAVHELIRQAQRGLL